MTPHSELSKTFDELLAKARAATLKQFDSHGLAWLCLVPDWTLPLAEACRFPSGSVDMARFVDDTAAAGLAKTWEAIGSRGETVRWFAATDDRRAELIRYLRDTWQPQEHLVAEARTITERLRETQPAPALENWALLVQMAASRRGGALASAETLWARVRDLVDHDDTGPALDWIYAGEALGPLLGALMTTTVARCRRYLERRYRKRIDDRYLLRHLRRQEQEDAVGRLLDDPGDSWALHIAGMGGVGKTMLIRSLGAGPFAQRHKVLVARVDFDHISPDYPLSRPGQLLVELSVELSSLFTNADQESRYERFLDDTERLHEISGGPETDPLAMLRTRQAKAVFASFAKLLRTLPAPVLLVLDTCEELAKLHPAGSRIPAVDATFEILERLHAEDEILGRLQAGDRRLGQDLSFRVLFAGRRLLAPSGQGWEADEDSRPPYLANLEPRPYLRLFEARGFDRDETVRYLEERRKLKPDPLLLDAVLAFSAEAGRVPGLPKLDSGERPRYNPYDIDLLADWLEAEPDIDPDALTASGLDGYVAARIFGRLDAELKPAAAAAALLGRFDERLLTLAGVPPLDSAGRPTLAKLLEQEWIDLERQDSDGARFVQIRPALWPRLQRYAGSADFAVHVAPVKPRLLRELRGHLENTPLRILSFEAVEAYLRLAGTADACAAWAAIERRVAAAPADAAGSAWSWVRSVTERLLGEAEGLTISPLLAAVSATLAAALGRTDPAASQRAQWTTVLAGAAAHPDPAEGTRLEQRARLGLLAADARDGVPEVSHVRLVCLHEVLRSGSDLAGSILASVEALLESRVPHDVMPEELARWLARAAAGLGDSPALAWGRSLHARLVARAGDTSSALGILDAAQAAALTAVDVPDAVLLDWSPPASVLHRIRAERLWLEWTTGRAVKLDRVEDELAAALASPGDDSWCLIALAAVVLLDSGHAAAAADKVMTVPSPVVGWSPRCALHRGVPPMAEVQARLLLAAGAGANARVLLRAVIAELSQDRAADTMVRRLRLAELQLIAALRDPAGVSAAGQAVYGDDPGLAAAGWLATTLTEPPRSGSLGTFAADYLTEDALLHARFRASTRSMLRDDQALVAAVMRRAGRDASPAGEHHALPATTIDLGLDALELMALGLAEPEGLVEPAALRASIQALAGAVQPGQEFEWARRHLRLGVLSGGEVFPAEGQVPDHRLGRLCLEEGEVLALRLPAITSPLLDQAYECGQRTGDWGMAVAAAVTAAVAATHAGQTASVSSRLERARQAWTELASVAEGLPTWADLGDAAEPDLSSWPVTAAAWGGWALRLRALLGQPAPDGIVQPPELDLKPWEGFLSPAPPPAKVRRSSSGWLVAAAAIGGAGGAGALYGLTLLVHLFFATVSPSTRLGLWPSFWIAWGGILLVFLVGVWGPWATRRLDRLLMSIFHEVVVCEPLDEGHALISVTRGLRPSLIRPQSGVLRRVLIVVMLSFAVVTATYFSLLLVGNRRSLRATQFSGEIPLTPTRPWKNRYVQVLAQQANRPLRVLAALRADASVDRPWEFLLAVSLTKSGGGSRRWYRPVAVPGADVPLAWPAADRAEVVSAQWQPFADEVWARTSGRLPWTSSSPPPPRSPGPARVVHVIGTPLLTSAGWRLRVAGTRSSQVSESLASSQYTPTRVGQSAAPGLLEPADPSLEAGTIIVVQVDPSGSAVTMDPDQSGGLRQFGRQVAVATRRPVIVVPSLPADLARTVMRSLARKVRRQSRAPSLDRTVGWVDDLRRAVLGGGTLSRPTWDTLAVSYDIALFWPVTDGKEA